MEMTSKHTPGPWHIGSRTDWGSYHVVDTDGNPIDFWVDANARLIAAAPELLDSLQQYTANDDALEAGLPFDTYTKEYNRISALAQAAIAKATGGAS